MLENVYILPLTFRHNMIQLHFIAHVHGTTVLLVSEVYFLKYLAHNYYQQLVPMVRHF